MESEQPTPDPYMSPPPIPRERMSPPMLPMASPYGTDSMPSVGSDDRSTAMLCHLLAIFTGFLGPLIMWLIKKDSSAFVAHHGRESLNFQITVFLIMLSLVAVTMVLMFVFIGFLLIPVIFALQILVIVAEIMAAVAAQRGDWYRYPFCLRLI